MQDVAIAISAGFLLVAAGAFSLLAYDRLPKLRDEKTFQVVRVIGSFFVVMTSLLISLLMNSAKNSYESINHDVHRLATEIILMDRDLRSGAEAAKEPRQDLLRYAQRVLEGTWPTGGRRLVEDREAELILDKLEAGLRRSERADQSASWSKDALAHLDRIVALRWTLIAAADGSIPSPVIAMVVVWLMLAFASFGYAAPRNSVVLVTLLLSAAIVSASTFVLLDMDRPFDELIDISPAPIQRAIAILSR